MSRTALMDMTRRSIAHAKAGTVDREAEVFRVPASNYYDSARWKLEMDRIFKRVPLMLGFSAELRDPGAYRSLEVAGVPVLLVRDSDGAVRAFVNMCSHRGAILAPSGSGKARRFVCPYHGWSYDRQGALVGITDRESFGELDASCHGLTSLPTAERAGLIFVVLTPDSSLDIDRYLCGYDAMLSHLGLEKCHLVGRQAIPGPNWKVAYDGYLDFYHLPILHKESFGSNMPRDALYDAWGPHQRVSTPAPWLVDVPEEDWSLDVLVGGVWTIFPHISIAPFDAAGTMYMVSQLFPGSSPEESLTVQNFLHTQPADDEQSAKVAEQMKFLEHVVANEDYATGLGIQRALKTGAKSEVLFGRNEGGGQRFHRWVDTLLRADDVELDELFTTARV